MSGNLAGNAAGLDVGDTVGYDVNSEGWFLYVESTRDYSL